MLLTSDCPVMKCCCDECQVWPSWIPYEPVKPHFIHRSGLALSLGPVFYPPLLKQTSVIVGAYWFSRYVNCWENLSVFNSTFLQEILVGLFHLDISHYFLTLKLYEDILTFGLKMRSLHIFVFLPAAKLSGILHVFQWHISIKKYSSNHYQTWEWAWLRSLQQYCQVPRRCYNI